MLVCLVIAYVKYDPQMPFGEGPFANIDKIAEFQSVTLSLLWGTLGYTIGVNLSSPPETWISPTIDLRKMQREHGGSHWPQLHSPSMVHAARFSRNFTK